MPHKNKRAQRGVTLLIVLIMLTAITLIGIGAIKSATLSERMAGAMRNQQLTYQAAEQALRYCERAVIQVAADPDKYKLEPEPLEADENTRHFEEEASWTDDKKTMDIAGMKEALNLSKAPRCMVEFINDRSRLPANARSFEDKPLIYPYRITVRAYGTANTDSVVSLQSYLRI